MTDTMDRRREVRAWMQPGRIMLLENNFAPTDKFLIVAANDPQLLCFAINSEIHPFIQRQPRLVQCQVTLRQADHTAFLKHDSHADCSKVINQIPLMKAVTQLVADKSRMKGEVTDHERQAIIAAIKASPILSNADKRHILGGWAGAPNA